MSAGSLGTPPDKAVWTYKHCSIRSHPICLKETAIYVNQISVASDAVDIQRESQLRRDSMSCIGPYSSFCSGEQNTVPPKEIQRGAQFAISRQHHVRGERSRASSRLVGVCVAARIFGIRRKRCRVITIAESDCIVRRHGGGVLLRRRGTGEALEHQEGLLRRVPDYRLPFSRIS